MITKFNEKSHFLVRGWVNFKIKLVSNHIIYDHLEQCALDFLFFFFKKIVASTCSKLSQEVQFSFTYYVLKGGTVIICG